MLSGTKMFRFLKDVLGSLPSIFRLHWNPEPKGVDACAAASWTAAVLCRFCTAYRVESARGLAQSKTSRHFVWIMKSVHALCAVSRAPREAFPSSLLVFLVVALLGLNAVASPAPASPATISPATLPLYFEANQGQAGTSAQFIAHGNRSEFLVSPDSAELVLSKSGRSPARAVQMRFVDANPLAEISGLDELSGKINYFIGNDSSKWQTGVPIFSKVGVTGIYPGVNLVYYGNGRQLEYDFAVAPKADPNSIVIHFDGVDKISIQSNGDLILNLGDDRIVQPGPVIYQVVRGMRKEISGGYKLADAQTIAFSVGEYDHTLPLVIDPILSYSTYFGGTGNDTAWDVAVDTNGFVYVAGDTTSSTFASGKSFSTPGAFQTSYHGGSLTGDAFIAKFNNSGTNLIYLTYLGGSADDVAASIAVDGSGNAYLTGWTASPDFPVTVNALYPHIGGTPTRVGYSSDAFVAELNPGGSNLVFSTYLGGTTSDGGNSIALDSANNIYVTGYASSTNFPVTANAYQFHSAVTNWYYQANYNQNAFVAEIGADGTNLLYSSYFGGINYDTGQSIAVDRSNYVYLTGFTASTNFPVTNAIMQTIGANIYNGKLFNGSTNQVVGLGLGLGINVFVAKFTPGFSNLVYSTYLGGANDDIAYKVAPDGLGNAYVTGWTVSTNFPITVTNQPADQNGLTNNLIYGYAITTNAFLTKIIWTGTNAVIGPSVVFGGTNALDTDIGYDLALDSAGNIYVTGTSISTNFPVGSNQGSLAATNFSGAADAFIIAFSNNISGVMYSAFLGGAANSAAYGIAVDPMGNAYIAGQTYAANFPTNNARQTTLSGAANTFLAKIISDPTPPPLSVSLEGSQGQVAWPSGLPYEPESSYLYELQTVTNLASTNWMMVPGAPILSNNEYSVVFIPTNGSGFYRLELVNP